jgi:soluble lytic murein transglycosylase-like protein
MIGRVRQILDRIEELNTQFRGMSPRKARREKPTFAAAVTEALQQPVMSGGKALPVAAHIQAAAAGAATPATKPVPGAGDSRFAGLIEQYAQKHGLDAALIRRVIEMESGFDPKAVSRKGAVGLMQLMPGTAKDMGVTDPFDPEENIAGGSKYLAGLIQRYEGDLSRALAAYNAGPETVRKYGGVPPYPETERYVERILAAVNTSEDSSDE